MSSWRKKSVSIEEEKEIITGMIVDDVFIRDIQTIYYPELFQTVFARIVGGWCIDYFRKYNKAPQETIQEIYNSHRCNGKIDKTTLELIEGFLFNLSEEYKKNNFNTSYALDKAEKFFKTRQLELLKDEIGTCLTENNIDKAESKIASFRRVERPSSVGIDIIKNDVEKYIRQEDDVLFTFPGVLGELFTPFCREDFVAIAAPMKRGKSWVLQEFGLKALVRDLKVIFYSLEMAEKKMIGRIYQHFLGLPKRDAKDIKVPYFTKENYIEYEYTTRQGINFSNVKKKRMKLKNMFSNGQFRLVCFPTYSINVEDIRLHLSNLEHYNRFVPDVIIIDYADILAPEKDSAREERHKLNRTWMALRGLAQEKHCLIVSASQTIRSTFKKNVEEDDLAEDIRKLAHVTHMLALNQSREDKKKGVMRVGMLVVRDDDFFVDNEVVVLQCFKIGKPFIDSRWKKDVKGLDDE